jgi:aminopeptidase N
MHHSQVNIYNYAEKYTETDLNTIFRETPQMLSFFEKVSGVKYEQSSYSQVLIGNHYQELSGFSVLKESYGSLVLKDSTETNLISHELAHQWWGNRITCGNWGHFWLNEALATFMSAAYNEHRFGKEKYEADIAAYYNVYDDIRRRGKDKPLVFENWLNPSKDDRNIVYFKGAYVLHLLRKEIGEKAFWEGIKVYSERYFDKAVTTKDFQQTFEEVSKKDLNEFFQKWVL